MNNFTSVDLQFSIGTMVEINLPAALYQCEVSEITVGRFVLRLKHTEDIDWMLRDTVVGAICRIEYPGGRKISALIASSIKKSRHVELEGATVPLQDSVASRVREVV